MKECKKCGYVELSNLEQKIYNLLPKQTNIIAKTLNKKRRIIYETLRRLNKYGVVKKFSKKKDRNIIWIKNNTVKQQLENLTDELIDNIINTPDKEILEGVKEDYGTSDFLANKVKKILEKAKNEIKNT